MLAFILLKRMTVDEIHTYVEPVDTSLGWLAQFLLKFSDRDFLWLVGESAYPPMKFTSKIWCRWTLTIVFFTRCVVQHFRILVICQGANTSTLSVIWGLIWSSHFTMKFQPAPISWCIIRGFFAFGRLF